MAAANFLKVAAGLVILIASAVMHMRKASPSLRQQITIIASENVESLLSPYKEVIGTDYNGYKNHVLRVLAYTRHLLTDQATFTVNQKAIELALVYHDIGLWTNSELSYLEPSLKHALDKADELHFSSASKALVRSIILEHHKLLPYKGPDKEIVEAVRQADLVDFSFGIVNHGISDRHIAEVYAALPESKFHLSLVRLLFTLQGYNIPKAVSDLSKIFKV